MAKMELVVFIRRRKPLFMKEIRKRVQKKEKKKGQGKLGKGTVKQIDLMCGGEV